MKINKIISLSLLILLYSGVSNSNTKNIKLDHAIDLIDKEYKISILRISLIEAIEMNDLELLCKIAKQAKKLDLDFGLILNSKVEDVFQEYADDLSPEFKIFMMLFSGSRFV